MEFNTKTELREHMNDLVEAGYLKLVNVMSEDGKEMTAGFVTVFDNLVE